MIRDETRSTPHGAAWAVRATSGRAFVPREGEELFRAQADGGEARARRASGCGVTARVGVRGRGWMCLCPSWECVGGGAEAAKLKERSYF